MAMNNLLLKATNTDLHIMYGMTNCLGRYNCFECFCNLSCLKLAITSGHSPRGCVVQWARSVQQPQQRPGVRHGGGQPGPGQPRAQHRQPREESVSKSAGERRPHQHPEQTGNHRVMIFYICISLFIQYTADTMLIFLFDLQHGSNQSLDTAGNNRGSGHQRSKYHTTSETQADRRKRYPTEYRIYINNFLLKEHIAQNCQECALIRQTALGLG